LQGASVVVAVEWMEAEVDQEGLAHLGVGDGLGPAEWALLVG